MELPAARQEHGHPECAVLAFTQECYTDLHPALIGLQRQNKEACLTNHSTVTVLSWHREAPQPSFMGSINGG
jgi:hypothetical protein